MFVLEFISIMECASIHTKYYVGGIETLYLRTQLRPGKKSPVVRKSPTLLFTAMSDSRKENNLVLEIQMY